jgi:NAD+ diphosphatase
MRKVPHHRHPANAYASGPLDRADALRADAEAVARALSDAAARLHPVWRGQNLVRYGEDIRGWSPDADRAVFIAEARETVFLGLGQDGAPHFALDFSHHDAPPAGPDAVYEDLRKIGPMMAADEGAVLAYARGLVHWHDRHQFCGVCGHPTESLLGGHQRRCLNETCRASHFPRTDPAVIMLVHDGGDRIVLGRQADWPPGRCSVLAGFVEPGESLEDAVAREVMEEVGLPVTDVTYHSSQPWPFPSSIMLGFTARALSEEMTVDTKEIEEARWVHRDAVRDCPNNDSFALPRRDSIAYRLIRDWL